jgi:hypothetical protein
VRAVALRARQALRASLAETTPALRRDVIAFLGVHRRTAKERRADE